MKRAERAAWHRFRMGLVESFQSGLEVERILIELNIKQPGPLAGQALEASMRSYDLLLEALNSLTDLLPTVMGSQTAAATDKRRREAEALAQQARELRERGRSIPQIAKALNRSPRHVGRYFSEGAPTKCR